MSKVGVFSLNVGVSPPGLAARLSDLEAGDMSRSVSVTLPCPSGVASNPLNQQPAMSAGLVSASPITFPEEQDDPRVSGDVPTGGGIWGFFKVSLRS